MMTTSKSGFVRHAALAVAAMVAGLFHASCGMDEVQVPALSGPSELGFSLKLDANPDVLTADGFSTALIVATARGPNSEPLPGRAILFAISSGATGGFADIGTLYNASVTSRLRAAEATAVTGPDGVAQVIYTAPARTDATADTSVNVDARPVGTDFNGQIYRSVRIELKSAEPRLFPVGGGTLTCNFAVEAPIGDATCTGGGAGSQCTVKVGAQVLFQDASSAGPAPITIVRYEWFFGDGTGVNYDIDQNHVFRSAGQFTVTHRVTDSTGAQQACEATINVQ
jgi:hypothetical protein